MSDPRSIEDREARIQDIDQRLAGLDAEYAGEQMPEEARAEWNELNAERDTHVAAVKEMKARKDRLAAIVRDNPTATETAKVDTAAFIRKQSSAEIYDVTRLRAESTSEDDYRDRLRDNARRAIERAVFPRLQRQDQDRTKAHVEDLLERCDDQYGTLAKRVLATGNPVYDRAFGKMLMLGGYSLTPDEQRAMSVGVDAEGGFAVPFQLDPSIILTSDGSISPLRQIARVEQITTKTWQGITSAGITVTRSTEGAQAADNSFAIGQPEVSPTRVIADVPFSVEADQDWRQFRSEVARLLADAKAREEDESFVTGTGVDPNPEGVAAGLAATSEVALGAAGTIATTDLENIESALPVRFRSRARWLANKSTYNAIRFGAIGSDGADLWVRLASGQPSELMGYPAHEASAMDSLATAAARVLLFGDFSEFLIVDRLGMTIEVNPHVVGANGRWTGQRAIVAVWRNSSLVLVDNAFRVGTDPTT